MAGFGLAETEKEDSPFRKLNDLLQDSPKPNAQTEKAVNEFVDEAEETVLEDVKVELARQLAKQKTEGEKPSMDAARRIFEHRLGLRMNVLSKAMDEQRFENLCDSIQKQGLAINKDQYKGLSITEYRKQKTELGLDAMKEISSGQTPAFRKMMNSAEAYVNSKGAAQEKETRQQLSQDIAEYVMKDCAPGKQDPDPTALNTAMYTLKSILPEKAFGQFVDQFNAQPGRGVHYKPEQFNKLPKSAEPNAERKMEDPVLTLEKPKPWEE